MEVSFETLQHLFKCKDNRVTSKDLKLQNANWLYVSTTCPWPSSLGKDISCSFLHQFEHFLLSWMCHLKLYKKQLKCKDNRVTSKDLKLKNANWSYVPTHIMPHDPLHLEKAYLAHSFINLKVLFSLDAPSKALQNHFEVQRQLNDMQKS